MNPYDAMLSDYKMPDMDGMAFYQHACALSSGLHARFILMTGAVLCPEILAFLREHHIRVLPKSFLPADVTRAIAEIFRTRRA